MQFLPATDPTFFVLAVSFALGLAVFAIAAMIRHSFRKPAAVISSPCAGSESLEIYAAPGTSPPPALPKGRVQVWFYHWLDLIGAGILFAIFSYLTLAQLAAGAGAKMELRPETLVVSIGFQFLIAGIAVILIAPRMHPVQWLGLKWPSWHWVVLIAPATVVTMWTLFAALQFAGYNRWIESLGVELVQDTVKLLQTSEDPVVIGLMVIAAVIAAPVCEEIVFRGYLYPVAKRFAGPWVAALSSALIFAAAHGSLAALLPLFLFGLVLVFIYEKTGSIWAPIAVHFCFNGATVAIQVIARYYNIPLEAP